MKVIVSTWVEAGGGSPGEIIQAMIDCGLPSRALVKDISVEYNIDLYVDDTIISPTPQTTSLRFEWEEER